MLRSIVVSSSQTRPHRAFLIQALRTSFMLESEEGPTAPASVSNTCSGITVCHLSYVRQEQSTYAVLMSPTSIPSHCLHARQSQVDERPILSSHRASATEHPGIILSTVYLDCGHDQQRTDAGQSRPSHTDGDHGEDHERHAAGGLSRWWRCRRLPCYVAYVGY